MTDDQPTTEPTSEKCPECGRTAYDDIQTAVKGFATVLEAQADRDEALRIAHLAIIKGQQLDRALTPTRDPRLWISPSQNPRTGHWRITIQDRQTYANRGYGEGETFEEAMYAAIATVNQPTAKEE